MSDSKKQREGFSSRWGFVLSCVGSAVGMGNIWRFPYMVSEWGGLTFILPYFMFVVLISSTGIIGEIALGRSSQAGPIGAFKRCTVLRSSRSYGRWIGIVPVAGALALAIGYTVVVGWILKYTLMAFNGELTAIGRDMDTISEMFAETASSWGNNMWLMLAIAVTVVIMACGVADGIEKVNKVMMPALFCLLLILGVYIAALPGAEEGYKYIFSLKPEGLKEPELWIFAFGQAFFSLSVAGNGFVIYGSYLSEKENIFKSAGNIAVFDTAAAILAALVIVPSMAVGGASLDSGGPGLMFIHLVNVFNAMPGGTMVGMIFYTSVLLAGITSLVNLYEVVIAALQEETEIKRLPAVLIVASVVCAAALTIQGSVSGWMDGVSIYVCPLGAMLAGGMFFYVMGKKEAMKALLAGAGKPVGRWFMFLGRYVYVPLTLLVLLAGIALGGLA